MQLSRGSGRVRQRADPLLGWLSRVGQRRRVQSSVCVVLVVWAVLSGRWSHSDLIVPGVLMFAVLGSAPLLTVRRFPTVSLSVMLLANSLFILFGRLAWPMANVVTWLIALVVCPIVLSRRRAVLALVGTQVVVLVAAAFVPQQVSATPWDATVAESLVALLAWTLGSNLQVRHRVAVEQAAVAARVLALQEADAASRGRVGIARELHDVVAHHVSLIAVRAATARYSMPDLSPAAERAFDEIADQARTALSELRTVLGVLRSPDVVPDQAPQPSLKDVQALVEQVRAAGAQVELAVSGARPVPDSVQLCGYRIVQEALTNAGRYAPGATVQIELNFQPQSLAVRVRNDAATAAPAQPAGSGYGLIGMRERVAMLDGTLHTGPCGDGFIVDAVLPLSALPHPVSA
jgi:signal transduction histidine kinase